MDLLRKQDFCASPYRSEREKVISVQRWNIRNFFKLLDKLEFFFENDKCCRLADNYLIAMVFTYFLRADFDPEEYTTQNFFAALLLAYNMEEDEGDFMLFKLEYWLECSPSDLKHLRDDLFRRMEYRGAVSRACCDIVMRFAKPEHKVWKRRRHEYHSGILGKKIFHVIQKNDDICPICGGDNDSDY